jgi:hypothetical protein
VDGGAPPDDHDPMKLVALVLGLAVAAVWGCGAGGDPESSADDEFTLPAGSGRADKSIPPATRSISGVLSFDDIEGGCGFLETADGTKYEVIYPADWVLDRAAATLRGPAGEAVPAGSQLMVRGQVATARSSTCQVGPIFEATSVEIPAG